MISGVLREFINQQKITCIATSFGELLSANFKFVPRIVAMVKFSSLAEGLIHYAKNGVVGHLCLKAGLEESFLLCPQIHAKVPKKVTLILELSMGIRTLLSWFREYGKNGITTKQVNKAASDTQIAIIKKVCDQLVFALPKEHMQELPQPSPLKSACAPMPELSYWCHKIPLICMHHCKHLREHA